MTFARAVFLFAILMLILGAVGANLVLRALFSDGGTPRYVVAARATVEAAHREASLHGNHRHSISSTRAIVHTAAPSLRRVKTTSVPARSTATTPDRAKVVHQHGIQQTPVRHHISSNRYHSRAPAARVHTIRVRPSATPNPTAAPTATPTGTIALAKYWVGSANAQPGTTIAIGYVIENDTGHAERITLGASLKSSPRLSWAAGAISDPGHDVVAVVPPGISTHVRYFRVGKLLKGGTYDVAWGLRNAATGERVALASASSALHVQRYVPAP